MSLACTTPPTTGRRPTCCAAPGCWLAPGGARGPALAAMRGVRPGRHRHLHVGRVLGRGPQPHAEPRCSGAARWALAAAARSTTGHPGRGGGGAWGPMRSLTGWGQGGLWGVYRFKQGFGGKVVRYTGVGPAHLPARPRIVRARTSCAESTGATMNVAPLQQIEVTDPKERRSCAQAMPRAAHSAKLGLGPEQAADGLVGQAAGLGRTGRHAREGDRFTAWAAAAMLVRRIPSAASRGRLRPQGPLLDWSDQALAAAVLRDVEVRRASPAIFVKIDPDVRSDLARGARRSPKPFRAPRVGPLARADPISQHDGVRRDAWRRRAAGRDEAEVATTSAWPSARESSCATAGHRPGPLPRHVRGDGGACAMGSSCGRSSTQAIWEPFWPITWRTSCWPRWRGAQWPA